VKFKTAALEFEFDGVHPGVAATLHALDEYSEAMGLPEVVVTDVLRTPAQQEAIYWRALQKAGNLTEEEARSAARKKFSWHLVAAAVDLRNTHYSRAQLEEAVAFLKKGRSAPMWEVLSHDVGQGHHLHVGRKDFSWRLAFQQKKKEK
jgi:hypothetical protein